MGIQLFIQGVTTSAQYLKEYITLRSFTKRS